MVYFINRFFSFSVEEKTELNDLYRRYSRAKSDVLSRRVYLTKSQSYDIEKMNKEQLNDLRIIASTQGKILARRFQINDRCNLVNLHEELNENNLFDKLIKAYKESDLSRHLAINIPNTAEHLPVFFKNDLEIYQDKESKTTQYFWFYIPAVDFTKLDKIESMSKSSENSKKSSSNEINETDIMRAIRNGDGDKFGL